MKYRFLRIPVIAAGILAAALLAGCGNETPSGNILTPSADSSAPTETTPEETVPATVPPDGDPNDVTCKGSYTVSGEIAADAAVAAMGETQLTNGQLQVYYWMEVAAFQDAQIENGPDFDRPLDTQICDIDDTAATWQQYFLQRALDTWHSYQALVLQGEEEGVPTEEAHQPNPKNYELYLSDIPATRVLYGYNDSYQPNDLHQAYLDNIPTMLEELAAEHGYASLEAMAEAVNTTAEELTRYAELANRSYMYLTELRYHIEPTGEDVEEFYAQQGSGSAESGRYVDLRHVLLIPEGASVAADGTVTCSDDAWENCEIEAHALLEEWMSGKATEAKFAELANSHSADPGSSINGGLYSDISQGQLTRNLDDWCFDSVRQEGDTAVVRSDCGVHILYLSAITEFWYAEAEQELISQQTAELVAAAREKYPVEVYYSAIELAEGGAPDICLDDILYPDIAHERFPVVPLYLQQEYPNTKYGAYNITSYGCGITSMSMLASYMADDELTPPEMCALYGDYCTSVGTDGSMFSEVPAEHGFFLKERCYDPNAAYAALEEGHIVVCVQHKGFWTRGGHYLVLERLTEEGLVQVRDSNLYNYGKLHGHKDDAFKFSTITPAGMCYWIYQPKVTQIPTCVRCGEGEGAPECMFTEDYYCEKCVAAMHRREDFLNIMNGAH